MLGPAPDRDMASCGKTFFVALLNRQFRCPAWHPACSKTAFASIGTGEQLILRQFTFAPTKYRALYGLRPMQERVFPQPTAR